jgi:hypothetical protein
VQSCAGKTVELEPGFEIEDEGEKIVTLHVFGSRGTRQVRRVTSHSLDDHTVTVDDDWRYPPEPDDEYQLRVDRTEDVIVPLMNGSNEFSSQEEDRPLIPDIPWGRWLGPLLFWIPLLLAFWLAIFGLSLIVHKQWAEHEHLAYPLSTIAASLLPAEDGSLSSVFRNRAFIGAFACVFAIRLINYVYVWFPHSMVQIQTRFDFYPIVKWLQLGAAHYIARPRLFFSVIAIAYFLAADASVSLGMTGIFYSVVFCTVLPAYGINPHDGDSLYVKNLHFLLFGAFVGAAAMVLYTGRHYYLNTMKASFGLRTREAIPQSSVWGGRALVAGTSLFVVLLVSKGTPLFIAVMYVCLMLMIHMIIGRVVAETGMFFIGTGWAVTMIPTAVLVAFLGPRCVSPEITFLLCMVCMIFTVDVREALIPFLLNTFRLFNIKKISIERRTPLLGIALVVGLAVALPMTFYCLYRFGVHHMNYWWVTKWLPSHPGREAKTFMLALEARGQLTGALNQDLFTRLSVIKPMAWGYFGWAAAGLVLYVGVSMCRLRFRSWPLHPVMFLVFMGFCMAEFWFSFLAGWFIKRSVVKYGGMKIYDKLKPLFIGLLAGEFIGALVPMIFGFLYYLVTGKIPPTYRVFPM